MARDNSGSMRKNDRKEKDSHPDYKGKATIAGVEFWISGWIKESDDGKWLSLAFDPKEKQAQEAPKSGKPTRGSVADMSDDIPF